ncbi:MAG: AAA family ATPase [Verrucomicrobia bacterium]|nr:AAA family ATPase [Verrucomicrobiota bacterium]
MRLLHYVEIENFKRYGAKQHIELDHPAVLIGPNNCGKTSAIQAIALWSMGVKTWYSERKGSSASERYAVGLNRLNILAVPVTRTRFFWNNARVRTGNTPISVTITVGIEHKGTIKPLTMLFRSHSDDLVYCEPDAPTLADLDLIKHAASLNVELLHPMSGLETEEPVLKPGRINVLLGQGQTAQVLRNLCLIVAKDAPDDWRQIASLMRRLFQAELEGPRENERGAVELFYLQADVKEPLDISLAGRGFQQLLLLFAYLFSHKRSVLLIDEPDAHLEILRQRQVYVLLREVAHWNESQVILVTHSEVVLTEALDRNLTLILEGLTEDLAKKDDIKNSLKHFGAEHYVRARETGIILYVEGSTDVDMLRGFAERLNHPVATRLEENRQLNVYYVQDNYPNAQRELEAELERVEGGFGIQPAEHFFALRRMLPRLKGLAILDNDGRNRASRLEGGLEILYWSRYEAENYFITPAVLRRYAEEKLSSLELFAGFRHEIRAILDQLIRERVFSNDEPAFQTYSTADSAAAALIWATGTARIKLSDFAEEYYRRLAQVTGIPMLLRKGELHLLIPLLEPKELVREVQEKLDALQRLLAVE